MKKYFFTAILICAACYSYGSRPFVLTFTPQYKGEPVSFGTKYYPLGEKDSIRFDALRFYVSNICFLREGRITFTAKDSFHLLDVSQKLMRIQLEVPETFAVDEIRFNLGIDSVTNNAGALGGDLDPTKGMYWTWQSGYINFKLEGVSSTVTDINHSFEYHLGGYAFPDNSCRKITLKTKDPNNAELVMDLDKFIDRIKIKETPRVMSPGKESMRISTLLAESISIKP